MQKQIFKPIFYIIPVVLIFLGIWLLLFIYIGFSVLFPMLRVYHFLGLYSLIFISICWINKLIYQKSMFELNDEGIKSRSDFLGIHETSIKYVDIKQVELSQGPIQRLYGIGSVSVTTQATTSNAGIELYDIKEYQEVYAFLLKKIQRN